MWHLFNWQINNKIQKSVNFGSISAQKCGSGCDDACCQIFKELQGVEQIQNHIFPQIFQFTSKTAEKEQFYPIPVVLVKSSLETL